MKCIQAEVILNRQFIKLFLTNFLHLNIPYITETDICEPNQNFLIRSLISSLDL